MPNDKQNKYPNKKEPGHLGGGPGSGKRSDEPVKKNYRNHNQEHILPSESRLEQIFGDDYKKDRK
ncbi:hypothetical protein NZD48_05125 [Staphylococcus hyicus]|uniref:hypothetical protein n=1 Tax=Staphylococcus hyicus TaxID=1284 RepID=UPI00217E9332|nr:hypothetical protein [Staphylococcus hyicus]UWF57691.1 hypothetical protein NZD48_05125 [Staphylococcus hyicus]